MPRQAPRPIDVGIATETPALFVRFWLTVTPLLPSAQASAEAKGRERYEGFIEALGRRLSQELPGEAEGES